MPSLFDPVNYGSIEAKNRIVLAPLTRARNTKEAVPTDIMVKYYADRASIGLIISEAVGINRAALGWPYGPGIWNQKQVDAWKPITKAVHEKGGKIVCQLWHMGRAVHSQVTGTQPLSASATKYPGQLHVYGGKADSEIAHPLSVQEIKSIVEDYATAAKNAIAAGFDGVQIHAANGYLIHQFLGDSTNLRTDEYGGSLENKTRLVKEVVAAITDAIGPERTGIRFSPNGEDQGVSIANPEPIYLDIIKFLNERKVAFVGLRESNPTSNFSRSDQPKLGNKFHEHFNGRLILNQDYTREEAIKTVEEGNADAISFGRPTIANPDIVEKFKRNIPLIEWANEIKYWYIPGTVGYTEPPPSAETN